MSNHVFAYRRITSICFLFTALFTLAGCGGGGGGGSNPTPPPVVVDPPPPAPTAPDFSEVDASFQAFIDERTDFDGISYVLVDADGIIHQEVFGDHTDDTVVLLASTSKVPAVMTLMALQEDANVDFSMSEPVSTYLAYDGPYADRTVEQMVSNTSGIPGLRLLAGYGSATGPTIEDFNHLCQFSAQAFFNFEACGQTLVQNELPTTQPAGSVYDYGGSQWQIAGVTASTVANATWNQLVDQYLVTPCGLEVFTFGNPWESPTSFTGSVDTLAGTSNPNVEGGAITNMADYAKLLQVHLNGGLCGDTQVLSEDSIASMQTDRGGVVATNATPYGMGWWIQEDLPGVFTDPGAFGAVSFIDINRGIGGYMAIDEYGDEADSGAPPSFFIAQAIPAIQAAWDAAQ
jgi:CubicO group peptidase (beta-lactamase class C family)